MGLGNLYSFTGHVGFIDIYVYVKIYSYYVAILKSVKSFILLSELGIR